MKYSLRIIILLCSLLFWISNVFPQKYLSNISSKIDFNRLSGKPLSDKYGQVSSIKVVYDVKAGNLYFINSAYYLYHFEFCRDYLGNDIDLNLYNVENYSDSEDRFYLLANLNYFKTLDIYALELSPVDMMTESNLQKLFLLVANNFFEGKKMVLLLNTARLQKLKSDKKIQMPVIYPFEIYQNLTYQAVSKGNCTGFIRFVEDAEAYKKIMNPNDIIILHSTPSYLPEVAGIIINEFQTPLSHLSILGQNRHIPVCAIKTAFEDSTLKKYQNQKVKLTVRCDTFQVQMSDNSNVKRYEKKFVKLETNLKVDTLVDVEFLNKKAVNYVGSKAANFGELFHLSKRCNFKTPEAAFAIPFYFYAKHIKKAEVKDLLYKIQHDLSIRNNYDSINVFLKKIREKIKNTPINQDLLQKVNAKIQANGGYKRLRFRSSTNAEDVDGFSGAGLYESKTGIIDDSIHSIEKAIKEVWASAWTYPAYAERELYHIPQTDVYMGILVHRSFPDEQVNGVAITKNLYRSGNYGFVVNAQLGDEKVVKSDKKNNCDQFICYPDESDNVYCFKQIVDIITLSDLNGHKLLMTDLEIQNMANQLENIKRHYKGSSYKTLSYLNYGLDVEFKLVGENRELYIKQVRIYNDR